MNRYCVAVIWFDDNCLKQEIVWANSEESAANLSSFMLEYYFPESNTTLEEAKRNAFDFDTVFSVIQVD